MKKVKKILITGGAGYIGNELIEALPKNIEIVNIDNFHIDTQFKRQHNKKLEEDRKLTLIESNVSEIRKRKESLKNIDVVVYMASLNSYRQSNEDPLLYLRENNINLQIFLNVLKQYSPGIRKFILTSTRGVYGEGPYICSACHSRINPPLSEKLKCTVCSSVRVSPQAVEESDIISPTSYYGISKKIQEDLLTLYCSEKSAQLDIFRIFNVYGENQGKYYSSIGIIPQIYAQITKNKEMYLSGNGDIVRDFVHISDVTKTLLASIFSEDNNRNRKEVFNLGSGQPIAIKDIADFFESMGYKFKRNRLEEFNDIKYSVADNSKVKKAFNVKDFTDIYKFLANSYNKI